MFVEVKRNVKRLLGSNTAKRGLTVFPDDVFIVSYPRSGNTWTRFLIANLIFSDEPISFNNIEQKIPDIYQNSDKVLRRIQRPRILKSHEYFDPRYKKVIYIVRDPRDIAISYFHFFKKYFWINEDDEIEHFIDQFLTGKITPQYGSWAENVGSWLGARKGFRDFFLLRYEDMLDHTEKELIKLAFFFNIDIDSIDFNNVIKACSAETMRTLERIESNKWRTTRNSDMNEYFVRSASKNSWKSEMPYELGERIMDSWCFTMSLIGYK